MKATFETDDINEIKILAKATDMAAFIWQLVHNGWRCFKHTEYDYQPAWDRIRELLNQHHIDIDEFFES